MMRRKIAFALVIVILNYNMNVLADTDSTVNDSLERAFSVSEEAEIMAETEREESNERTEKSPGSYLETSTNESEILTEEAFSQSSENRSDASTKEAFSESAENLKESLEQENNGESFKESEKSPAEESTKESFQQPTEESLEELEKDGLETRPEEPDKESSPILEEEKIKESQEALKSYDELGFGSQNESESLEGRDNFVAVPTEKFEEGSANQPEKSLEESTKVSESENEGKSSKTPGAESEGQSPETLSAESKAHSSETLSAESEGQSPETSGAESEEQSPETLSAESEAQLSETLSTESSVQPSEAAGTESEAESSKNSEAERVRESKETSAEESTQEAGEERTEEQTKEKSETEPLESIGEPVQISDEKQIEENMETYPEEAGDAPVYSVLFPAGTHAYLDPGNLSGRGQIFSNRHEVANYGNTDVVIKIKNIQIHCESEDNTYEFIQNEVAEENSRAKKLNVNMIWQDENEINKKVLHVADGSPDQYVILLKAANYDENGEFVSLNDGSRGWFYFTGTINSNPNIDWEDDEIMAVFDYEIVSSDAVETTDSQEEESEPAEAIGSAIYILESTTDGLMVTSDFDDENQEIEFED